MEEIRIPVPWGHIAAKAHGDAAKPPILCFHGILDNAGSFDRLIPLLPQNHRYICIDLPGHGRSSHFPPHLPLFTVNYILCYKHIYAHFNIKRCIIMGHSYGGQVALLYAQLYPEQVEKLILLDTVHLFPVPATHLKDYLVDKFDQHIATEEKLAGNNFPRYTYEEAMDKLLNRRHQNKIPREAAEPLLQRMLVECGDGKFRYSYDQRLKNFMNPMHDWRYMVESLKQDRVLCPVILILGKHSKEQQYFFKYLLNYYRKLKNFSIVLVNGDHDVHNSYPQNVAPHVTKFLLRNKL